VYDYVKMNRWGTVFPLHPPRARWLGVWICAPGFTRSLGRFGTKEALDVLRLTMDKLACCIGYRTLY
jgi:hypothetical protein